MECYSTDNILGKGHYARNKATHKQRMKSEGKAMHHHATGAIKAAVDKLLDSLMSRFATAYDLVLKQIREEIKSFFDLNSSNGTRNSTRRVVSIAKVHLQKDLSADINTLAHDWGSKLPVNSGGFRPDIESDDEMDVNDQIFVDIDNSPDDDYQDDSD
jgi:hypothetical protein